MQSDKQEDELFTVAEVAKRLRVSQETIRTWVEQGTIKAVRLPTSGPRKRYRILSSTIEKILHPPQQEAE